MVNVLKRLPLGSRFFCEKALWKSKSCQVWMHFIILLVLMLNKNHIRMKKVEFKLTQGDYIQLSQLLKAVNVAENGAMAGAMVLDGVVMLNGQAEGRKRAKIRVGDVVTVFDYEINVI